MKLALRNGARFLSSFTPQITLGIIDGGEEEGASGETNQSFRFLLISFWNEKGNLFRKARKIKEKSIKKFSKKFFEKNFFQKIPKILEILAVHSFLQKINIQFLKIQNFQKNWKNRWIAENVKITKKNFSENLNNFHSKFF